MKFHADIETDTQRFIVVETYASNMGQTRVAERVVLRLVSLPLGVEYTSVRTRGAEVLAAKEVSTKSFGSYSPRDAALRDMLKRLDATLAQQAHMRALA
jgi:hypothetical protein